MFQSRWLYAILLLLITIFSVGFARSYMRTYAVNKEITQLETTQKSLEQERAELSSLLKKIQSTAHAESIAREQFGLRKPGENAIVIQREESTLQKSDDNSKKTTSLVTSNPHAWWIYFFE